MTVQGLSWGVAAVVAPVVGATLLASGPATLWLAGAAVSLVLAAGHALWSLIGRTPDRAPVLSTR